MDDIDRVVQDFINENHPVLISYIGKISQNVKNLMNGFQLTIISSIETTDILRINRLFQNQIGISSLHSILKTLQFLDWLVLSGQRFSKGSIMDSRALAPTNDILLDLADLRNKENLSVAAIALSKHQNRSEFWGEIRGNSEQKSRKAREMVEFILRNYLWRNSYIHFKHGIVYEFRMNNGYGARWNENQFIGFVEPIDINTGVKVI